MVEVKTWVTAGTSAAVPGSPAAVASTGDPARAQTSGRSTEVLGAYGITGAPVVETEEVPAAAAEVQLARARAAPIEADGTSGATTVGLLAVLTITGIGGATAWRRSRP